MRKNRWILILLACLLALTLVACDAGDQNEQASSTDQNEQASSTDQSEQKPSGTAPDFTVLDANGNEVRLSDFFGKPVVINFWATWCGYCVREMPDFDKAYDAYPDVVFLMVNATDGEYETVEKAKAYVESEGFDFDVYFDTQAQAATAYQITGYPTTIFVDANGDVVAKRVGMISYDTLIQGIDMITE